MFAFAAALSIIALIPAIGAVNLNGPTYTVNGQVLSSQALKNGPFYYYSPQPLYGRQFLAAAAAAPSNEVVVQAPVQPVQVHYQSQSVPLNVRHTHIPAPKPEAQLSRSEEEAHVIVHEVIRPVIQEVREIIQPYRRIIQEIRPVQETVVSKVASSHGTQAAAPAIAHPTSA